MIQKKVSGARKKSRHHQHHCSHVSQEGSWCPEERPSTSIIAFMFHLRFPAAPTASAASSRSRFIQGSGARQGPSINSIMAFKIKLHSRFTWGFWCHGEASKRSQHHMIIACTFHFAASGAQRTAPASAASLRSHFTWVAATAFGKLTRDGAWEKAARSGVTDGSLKKTLEVRNPFLRKFLLHDVWLSQEPRPCWRSFGMLLFCLRLVEVVPTWDA